MLIIEEENNLEIYRPPVSEDTPLTVNLSTPSGAVVLGPNSNSPFEVESSGLNVGKTGYLRGGQTAYNTGTGFFLGYENDAYVFSIGSGGSTSNSLTWDGTTLTVNGYAISGKGNFGGNGADGALSITSGTTTVSAGSAAIFFKNYTSISITGTGVLAFSSPHDNGTIGIIKSKGAVTITSSATPAWDGTGMGAAGAATNSGDADGSNGNDNADILDTSNHFGAGGVRDNGAGGGGAGGAEGVVLDTTSTVNRAFPYTTATTYLYRQKVHLQCGSGGGSGASRGTNAGGLGGRGGGGFLIECGGAWNFTTASGISVAGIAGGNAGTTDSGAIQGGGGGGGGAGHFVALYNSVTANTGTIVISGGNGGNSTIAATGGTGGGCGGGGGGGGVTSAGGAGGAGGNANANGTAGTNGTGSAGGTGGTAGTSDGSSNGGGGGGGGGGTGTSLIAENLYYA